MSGMLKQEGAGLMLNRKVGTKVIMMSKPDVSDEEILAAMREGIVLTVVGLEQGQNHKQNGNSIHRDEHGQYDNQRNKRHFNRGGVARIGIKAQDAIYIAREELLTRQKKES